MAQDITRDLSTPRSWARDQVSGSFVTDEAVSYAKSKISWKWISVGLAVVGFALLPAKKTRGVKT